MLKSIAAAVLSVVLLSCGDVFAEDGTSGTICQSSCLRANTPEFGYATPPSDPPCWKREAEGFFSCFDYVEGGKCHWKDMTDCHAKTTPPTTTTSTTTSPTQQPTTNNPVTPTSPVPTQAHTSQPRSDNKVCQSKCLRGNYQGGGWAYAPHAAPCWRQENGYFSCYEYINGKCEWEGMTDCGQPNTPPPPPVTPATQTTESSTSSSSDDVCTSKCLRGNYPGGGWAYAPNAAPCWMKQNGYFSCYEYISGKCEWEGMTDCGNPNTTPPSTNQTPQTSAPTTPARHTSAPSGQVCTSKCLRGNYPGGGWAFPPHAAPCWKLEDGGYFSCYEYIDGECEWEGMTNCGQHEEPPAPTDAPHTPSASTFAPTDAPSDADDFCTSKCLRGDYAGGGWAYAPNAAPCWIKKNGYFACFEYKNGKCEWDGMTDCKTNTKKKFLRY